MTTQTIFNRSVVAVLTNKSGGAHAQGDVCVGDGANAISVINDTSGAYTMGVIWVCIEPAGVANNAQGKYASSGFVPKINLSSSASLGDAFGTHTVAKQAVRHAAPLIAGDFGMVLETGTSPSAMLWGAPSLGAPLSLATVAEAGTGTNTTKAVSPAGLFPAKEDVASGSTTNIGAATSRLIRITGTTTITAFDTVADGIYREGWFEGVLTLTHNGTSLILPGAANITTAAGDSFGAVSLGSGNWKVIWYTKADGTPIAGGGGGGGGTNLKTVWSSDAPPASPSAYDSEFSAGGGGVPSGFTEYDPGSKLAVDESVTYKKLIFTITSGTFPTACGIYRSIPAGDFTIWTKVHLFGQRVDYIWGGLALYENATDSAKKIANFCLTNRASAGPIGISQFLLNAYNAYASDSLALNGMNLPFQYLYLRWRRNGTNYFPGWSLDGETFQENTTASVAIGFTPTHFGLGAGNSVGADRVCMFDFFRYVASDVGVNGIMNGAAINLLV